MTKDADKTDSKLIKDKAGANADRSLSEQGISPAPDTGGPGGGSQQEGCACNTSTSVPSGLPALLLLACLLAFRRKKP